MSVYNLTGRETLVWLRLTSGPSLALDSRERSGAFPFFSNDCSCLVTIFLNGSFGLSQTLLSELQDGDLDDDDSLHVTNSSPDDAESAVGLIDCCGSFVKLCSLPSTLSA